MRIVTLGCVGAALCAAQAQAQEAGSGQVASADTSAAFRPGSPSNATTTVSPSAVPQNMPELDRLDDSPDRFMVSLGLLYAGGDFGADTNTRIWSSALGLRAQAGPVRLTASLPYMRIRSDAVIFTGIDSTPVLVAPDAGGRRTNKGFGDLTLGAAYSLPTSDTGAEVELSGRVKIDTAERSSGLTSGKLDYALGLQVTQPIGRVAPFFSVTYRFLGDTAEFTLRDGFAASAGTSFKVGEGTYLLASYHFAERATGLVRDSHELFAGVTAAVGRSRFRITGFGTAGLSRGAAGVSAGLALARSF